MSEKQPENNQANNSPAKRPRGFIKGQSGNPKGRPKGSLNRQTWANLTGQCKREYAPSKTKGQTGLAVKDKRIKDPIKDIHKLAYIKLWDAVSEGKQWAVRMVMDHSLGKPVAQVNVDSHSTKAVAIGWAGEPPGSTGQKQDPTEKAVIDITDQAIREETGLDQDAGMEQDTSP